MGKFDDALKKARMARGKPAGNPKSSKVVKMPREEIESLRLETEVSIAHEPRRAAFNGRIDPKLASLQDPSSAAAECFKTLRSKVMVSKSGKLCRTIMVTGAQPLDGKSMVAANLAVSIAQGINHYVLLVDCDLRRQDIHKRPVCGIAPNRHQEDAQCNQQHLRDRISRWPKPDCTPLMPFLEAH